MLLPVVIRGLLSASGSLFSGTAAGSQTCGPARHGELLWPLSVGQCARFGSSRAQHRQGGSNVSPRSHLGRCRRHAQDPANLRSAQRRHRCRRRRREGVGPAPLQLLPCNPAPAPLPPARPTHRRRGGAGSSDRAARGPRSSEPVPVGAGDDAPCVAHLAASTRPVDKGRGGGRRRLAARVAAGRRAARARITRPAGIAQLARRARRGGSLRTPASRPPSQAILACARWARSCAKASRCAL